MGSTIALLFISDAWRFRSFADHGWQERSKAKIKSLSETNSITIGLRRIFDPLAGLALSAYRVMRTMSEADWNELLNALHDYTVSERAVAAARRLQQIATKEDIPRLLTLLNDGSFFVREAAAWPLSDLGVISALPDLLDARHRGFQEGHDNDALSAALADMVEANPRSAEVVLKEILGSGERHLREHALWLLEFCKGERDP